MTGCRSHSGTENLYELAEKMSGSDLSVLKWKRSHENSGGALKKERRAAGTTLGRRLTVPHEDNLDTLQAHTLHSFLIFLLTFRAMEPISSQTSLLQTHLYVRGFSWSTCDDLPHPVTIESLSISPDPIHIPGDVTVAVVISTSIDLERPLMLNLTLEKKFLGAWIKIPCLDNLGSCTYDACDLLDTWFPVGQPCPEPLLTYGIPCHCPFIVGTSSLPSSVFYIPAIPLPSWLESGTYRVKGILSNAQGEVGCVHIHVTLA
ncbi:ganglioside GM2 activator-like [Ambystoma mexicanum]|uniref:ganglioside GM2 activator-like n=1 Tax=Ambystoma mexicanum TaxID=8296 RepID=UPI0037E7BFB0